MIVLVFFLYLLRNRSFYFEKWSLFTRQGRIGDQGKSFLRCVITGLFRRYKICYWKMVKVHPTGMSRQLTTTAYQEDAEK